MEFEEEIQALYQKYEKLYNCTFESLSEILNKKTTTVIGVEWGILQHVYKLVFNQNISSCRKNIAIVQKALKLRLSV